ncbi:MAG: hypothetical protein Q4D06_04275 [Coriobacteriia bacterium]|nr:hypothetical protein [Coriobacteriia bacterium]
MKRFARLTCTFFALIAAALLSAGALAGCSVVDGAVEELGNQAGIHHTDKQDHAGKGNSNGNGSNGGNGSSANAGHHAESGHHVDYVFRSSKHLRDHYNKHGRQMGFASAQDYEEAASDVANNPKALHKIEREDGDDVYYLEVTNEFVVVSTDGYLRTYFCPDSGKRYFDRQ